jgi:Ca2+-binding EF-hand superfamily protein
MTKRMLSIGLGAAGMAAIFCFPSVRAARAAGGDPDMAFEKIDQNSDGKISPDEFAAAHKAKFTKMDTNGDGKLSVDEMLTAEEHHEKMTGKAPSKAMTEMMTEKIKKMDTNGDGFLSEEEFMAGSKTMFDKMDTNHDGYLSKAEFKAGHEKMKAKMEKKEQEQEK